MTPAANLVVSLRARGITFAVRNNRLWLLPAAAYKTLTDAERATMRARRDELKRIARGDLPVPVAAPSPNYVPKQRPKPPEPVIQPREYESVGLFYINGVLTCSWGDDVAQDILYGRVHRQDAERWQRARQDQQRRLMWTPSIQFDGPVGDAVSRLLGRR